MFNFKAILTLFLFATILSCKTDTAKKSDNINTKKTYTLTAFSPSQKYNDASLSEMNYKNGQFSFAVGGDLYALGTQTPDAAQKMCANSAKGQHIHLIIDALPYAAKYESTFAHDVTDGTHHALAFLSRSYHESIKTRDAHIAEKIVVKDKSISSREKITNPMLFYSRPKGTYVGKDTERVMLDFYLVNASLSAGNYVMADINGEEHRIDKWQPYYIEGLPMGENTITLSYYNKDGSKVDTPNNPVSRTFKLMADPAPKEG